MRVETLRSYKILDTARDEGFEDLVDAVCLSLNVPIALVSLIDLNRQWFKAARGVEVNQTERDIAICSYTILCPEPLVVCDTEQDHRFADNPLVRKAPFIRFYIGVPIVVADGQIIGTVCALDTVPRTPLWSEVKCMKFFARQTAKLLELHLLKKNLSERDEKWKYFM